MNYPTHPRARAASAPFTCQTCGGPCRTWKGSVHRWTCRTCLAAYVANQTDPDPAALPRSKR